MNPATARHQTSNQDLEIQRQAYNAAFNELDLSWFWDANTHRSLLDRSDEREQIRVYIETRQAHLLMAYDADFLVNAIHATKRRRIESMSP